MPHVVHFYEDEPTLAINVARFVDEGAALGDRVLVVARTHRGEMIRTHTSNAFTFVDAEEMLERLMVGDMPDVRRFLEAVKPLHLDRAPRLRGYGEMVDLLCQRGNRRAAIALEGLWNELARQYDLKLLCGYAAQSFRADRDSRDFDEICWAHSRTVPAELTFDAIKQRVGTSA